MSVAISDLRVIVTAGGDGIGRAIAEAFLEQGAAVEVCDVSRAALDEFASAWPGLGTSLADVADEAAVDGFCETALGRLGGLDVLVNNAGIAGPTGPVETLSLADWSRTLAVDLTGQFLCLRRAVPALKRSPAASVINIASTAGLMGYPLRTPYATAKWGVIGLTKSAAMELGPHGVRVNAICPGPVEGERMVRVIAAEAEARGLSPEAVRASYAETTSLRCFIDARDIAAKALFLCSPAGARISGQAISVDGHTEMLVG